MLTGKCKKCSYRSDAAGGSCDYIGVMHKRRPCPAGEECTEFAPGAKLRQRAIPSPAGRNGRRKPPAEPDLLEYMDALDTALTVFGEAMV